MRRFISLLIAVVMVVCMSTVAFADLSPNEDNLFSFSSGSYNIGISHIAYIESVVDFLTEWRDSNSNLLLFQGSSSGFSADFIIAPLTSGVYYYSSSSTRGLVFSEGVRVLTLYSFSSQSYNNFFTAGSVVGANSDMPYVVSGSYFANTDIVLDQSMTDRIDTRKYTIYDNWGIFDGWESSFDGGIVKHTVSVNYKYEDGTTAAPTVSSRYDVGDSYKIDSPAIDGYTASVAVVSGDNITSSVSYDVVYSKVKTCEISVSYQYENGDQAFSPFSQTFNAGDSYSITSPELSGYVPSVAVLHGTVTADTSPSASFTVVYRVDRAIVKASDFDLFSSVILETIGLLVAVGCTIFCSVLVVRFAIKVLGIFTK